MKRPDEEKGNGRFGAVRRPTRHDDGAWHATFDLRLKR